MEPLNFSLGNDKKFTHFWEQLTDVMNKVSYRKNIVIELSIFQSL